MEPAQPIIAECSDGATTAVRSADDPKPDKIQQDRCALIRIALRTLVAKEGFHGASMSAVAKEAGVASGTAYVYYKSKDELVLAAYKEAKFELTDVCFNNFISSNDAATIDERFVAMWLGMYHYLQAKPDEAHFLQQVEASPYAATAHHEVHAEEHESLVALATHPELSSRFIDAPLTLLWVMGFVPAIWLATQQADNVQLDEHRLRNVAKGCWRAISKD